MNATNEACMPWMKLDLAPIGFALIGDIRVGEKKKILDTFPYLNSYLYKSNR